ncbi:multicopper oxidase family protein [Amorphoplanes nipponensis]|uniref:Multicopper oxidase CueO n=1 Tax=Actinoplanes nipponensis TaxID=135950 RepID=A0A919MJU3_9ACTN|nr:multicopper oxidase family protein [Actinoplanes nipponensis]GIE52174.1 spore coat protein A [Actinoplanes nipponensis]
MKISRRALLSLLGGTGAAAAVGVPLVSGLRGATSTGALLSSRLPLPPPFTRPFRVPPVLTPTRRDESGDHYEITQRAARVEILPGVRTPIWGYNGIFPGPTIISSRGRPVVVTHRNELPVPVVVHLHGGHTPAAHDGFPTDLLYPVGMPPAPHNHPHAGALSYGAREYRYPIDQSAATLWYHDHRMDFTGPAVWRGLAAFHLIHDPAEDRLRLPAGDRDLPIMITDRAFAANGTLRYPSLDPTLSHTPGVTAPYAAGVLGDVLLVNGVPWPLADVPAARHRLRLLNASNARRYRLALDPLPRGGSGLIQIGTDGGLLTEPVVHEAVELAPGQRCDVIVDFSRYRTGQQVTLRNEFGDRTTAVVMRFRVTGPAADPSRIPDSLAPAPASARTAAVRDFHFRHDTLHGRPGWTINGNPFSPAQSNADPLLGTTEVWRLTSDFHHPVHLHLGHFRILSRGIGGPGPYDHGPRDTIDLRPGEQATIAVSFTDYAGRYVFHCHNLEHEDMAMMGVFTTHPRTD